MFRVNRSDTALVRASTAVDPRTQAKTALSAWRRNGHHVDPLNDAHVGAYLALAAMPSTRLTPSRLTTYLATLEETVTHGEEKKQEVWVVPKGNFKDRLPQDILDALINRDGSEDNSDYYYIDMLIERNRLGLGVTTTSKFLLSQKSAVVTEPDTRGPLALTNGDAATGEIATGGAATGGADAIVPATGVRSLQQQRSDAGAPPSPETASMKKARTQRESLALLKRSMTECAADKRWTNVKDAISPNSVRHWMGNLTSALEELHTKEVDQRPRIEVLCFKFTSFIVKLFMMADLYPHLVEFKGIMPRLLALCGDAIDDTTKQEAALVEQLASIPADGDGVLPEDAEASVFVLTGFQNSELFISFLVYRGQRAIKQAAEAKTNTERLRILETVKDMRHMPANLTDSIRIAAFLCDEGIATGEIAMFIFTNQPQASQMAEHWFPTTALGVVGCLMRDAIPELEKFSYEEFEKAAQALVQAEIAESLKNKLAMQAVAFVNEGIERPQACKDLFASVLIQIIIGNDADHAFFDGHWEGVDQALWNAVVPF